MKQTTYQHYAIALTTTLIVIAGIAALWGGVSLVWRCTCGTMALVAAADAAILFRLAGFPPGVARARMVLASTALAILAGAFVVAAIRIGIPFGTLPHEAIWRIDPELAILWWRLNINWWDGIAMLFALPLAWRVGR